MELTVPQWYTMFSVYLLMVCYITYLKMKIRVLCMVLDVFTNVFFSLARGDAVLGMRGDDSLFVKNTKSNITEELDPSVKRMEEP